MAEGLFYSPPPEGGARRDETFARSLKNFKNQVLQGPRPPGQTADPWTIFCTFFKTLKIIDLGPFLASLWEPCGAPVGIIFGVIFWTIFRKALGTLPNRLRPGFEAILKAFWLHFWSHCGSRIEEG